MELRSRYGLGRAAEKQKEQDRGMVFGYKQATPNGVWGVAREGKPINSRKICRWLSKTNLSCARTPTPRALPTR